MKITTVDTKRRLVLPDAQPGETYAVWHDAAGHYELTKVIPVPRKSLKSGKKLDALMISAGLTPKMSSEKLRNLTRDL